MRLAKLEKTLAELQSSGVLAKPAKANIKVDAKPGEKEEFYEETPEGGEDE
jgi:hypothetical protein